MQLLNIKKGRLPIVITRILFAVYVVSVCVVGAALSGVPDEISLSREEFERVSSNAQNIDSEITVKAKLFGALPLKDVKVNVFEENALVPCGDVFGVKFFTKGVVIVKMSDIPTKDGKESPAEKAGLVTGDIIEKIDGAQINTVEAMAEIVENCKGKDLAVSYRRDGKEQTCVMTPVLSLSDKKYKTGLWVRDSTAGIGTMTYYNPKTGEFAGLGHGICDVDTGLLMPLLKASVVDVEITDIIKGRRGTPGELKGDFDKVKMGYITKNTKRGVYGIINKEEASSKAIPIGFSDELQTGKATILCELDADGVCEYDVEIVKINENGAKDKNFVIRVADENLIKKTGGIVQGMSGSPVIQNGKLVGAVTHVLVNNPEKGYGIFIENMLSTD